MMRFSHSEAAKKPPGDGVPHTEVVPTFICPD